MAITVRRLRRVEAWSNWRAAGGTRQAVVDDAIACRVSARLEDDTISLVVPLDSAAAAYLGARKLIRIDQDDATYDEYRITDRARDEEQGRLVITAQPLRTTDLQGAGLIQRLDSDGVIVHDFESLGLTAAEHIDNWILPALAAAGFGWIARGTTTPTMRFDMTYSWDTPLAALKRIAEITQSELDLRRNGDAGYYIDIVTRVNSAAQTADIRVDKNLVNVTSDESSTEQATIVFPRGAAAEEHHATMARATWRVANIAGLVLTLEDPAGGKGPIQFSNQLVGAYIRKPSGALTVITSSTTGQLVTVASAAALAIGDLVGVRANGAGKDLVSLEDPAAVAAYGPKAGVRDVSDVPGTNNLVKNPVMRDWPGSPSVPPTNWTAVGAPTIDRQTAAPYTAIGGKSIKVTGTADGQGVISDAVPIFPTAIAPFLSGFAKVWVASGNARVELVITSPSGTKVFPLLPDVASASVLGQWADLGPSGYDANGVLATAAQIRIVQHGVGASVFYIDAAQITQSATQEAFFEGSGGTRLWQEANEALRIGSNPINSYTIALADLEAIDPITWNESAIILGANAHIVDSALALDLTTRIVSIERDYLNPQATAVTLSTRFDDLTDLLAQSDRPDRSSIVSEALLSLDAAPVLEVELVPELSTNTTVAYRATATTPAGVSVQLFYAFGDDDFPGVSNLANAGIIQVPKATNDSGDRALKIKALGANGLAVIVPVTVDYDLLPEIAITAERTPIYSGGIQVGWRIRGTADDDTRAVTVAVAGDLAIQSSTSSAGVFVGPVFWLDTRTSKQWWIDLLQTPGQSGTATLTPREFWDSVNGGLGGQPAVISLARSAITTLTIRDLSATIREVTITATPATATVKHRVNAGAWQEHVGSVTFTVDVEASAATIEYHSYTASGTVEEIKRVVVDQDEQPGITSISLIESSPNVLQLDLGFDDDVVSWRMWARRNAWPTAENTSTGRPLEPYIRYDRGVERTSVDWRASGNGDATSQWHVIVRAYDDVGNFVLATATKMVSGAPPAVGALTNVRVEPTTESTLDYNDFLWDHNQEVQDTGHTVTIRENGVTKVASGTRDARLNHDDALGATHVGGWHIQRGRASPGAPGAEYLTWNYEIDLRKTSDGSLVATYSASISGWYTVGGGGGGGAPPPEIPNTLAAFGEVLQARGTWNNTSATAAIHIEWEKNGVLQGPIALAAGVATHTLTGLIAGDDMRFRVRYYNGYGNGTWSAWSSTVEVLPAGSPPTEYVTVIAIGNEVMNILYAQWTNGSSAYQIRIDYERNITGVWTWQATDTVAAGSTYDEHGGFTTGWEMRMVFRYFNEIGEGPYVFSEPYVMQ